MQRHFDTIETLVEIGSVLTYVRDLALKAGVVRMSYRVRPLFENQRLLTTEVYTHGYDQEWLDLYEREGFREIDPIPERVMEFGSLMTWLDAKDWLPNTPEEEHYFDRMHEYGLIHGFGVPLYGRNGKGAYAGFDFEKHVDEVDPDAVGLVRSLAQAGHQRISLLVERKTPGPALSEREVEVLTWAARGKSLTSIATILGLSPDTVKTYSRRVYAKLDATDRVGAVVKALKLGIVNV